MIIISIFSLRTNLWIKLRDFLSYHINRHNDNISILLTMTISYFNFELSKLLILHLYVDN